MDFMFLLKVIANNFLLSVLLLIFKQEIVLNASKVTKLLPQEVLAKRLLLFNSVKS